MIYFFCILLYFLLFQPSRLLAFLYLLGNKVLFSTLSVTFALYLTVRSWPTCLGLLHSSSLDPRQVLPSGDTRGRPRSNSRTAYDAHSNLRERQFETRSLWPTCWPAEVNWTPVPGQPFVSQDSLPVACPHPQTPTIGGGVGIPSPTNYRLTNSR